MQRISHVSSPQWTIPIVLATLFFITSISPCMCSAMWEMACVFSIENVEKKRTQTDAIHCIEQWAWMWLNTPNGNNNNTIPSQKENEKKKNWSAYINIHILHTKHIKIFRRNEIIYHFPCGRVATDPFLNRFACMLYFPWHSTNKSFTPYIHTTKDPKRKRPFVCVSMREREKMGKKHHRRMVQTDFIHSG